METIQHYTKHLKNDKFEVNGERMMEMNVFDEDAQMRKRQTQRMLKKESKRSYK